MLFEIKQNKLEFSLVGPVDYDTQTQENSSLFCFIN